MIRMLAVAAQQLAAGGVARDRRSTTASSRATTSRPTSSGAGLAEVRAEIANLDTRLSTDIAGVRTELASLETRLIRWMVGTDRWPTHLRRLSGRTSRQSCPHRLH